MMPIFNANRLAIVGCLSLVTTQALALTATFDFVGTITDTRIHQQYQPDTIDTSMQGQPVRGRITIQTDSLPRYVFEYPDLKYVTYPQAIDDLAPHFTASLSINGSPLDPMSRTYPRGLIMAIDFLPDAGPNDAWALQAGSMDRVLIPEYTVPAYRWTETKVTLNSASPELAGNWFTLTGEESAEDLVAWVLGTLNSGSYSVETSDCLHIDPAAPVCQPPFSSVTHRFVVDSIARTVE